MTVCSLYYPSGDAATRGGPRIHSGTLPGAQASLGVQAHGLDRGRHAGCQCPPHGGLARLFAILPGQEGADSGRRASSSIAGAFRTIAAGRGARRYRPRIATASVVSPRRRSPSRSRLTRVHRPAASLRRRRRPSHPSQPQSGERLRMASATAARAMLLTRMRGSLTSCRCCLVALSY